MTVIFLNNYQALNVFIVFIFISSGLEISNSFVIVRCAILINFTVTIDWKENLDFHSVLCNIKLSLIACEIFQFLCKAFYESFSLFCEKDKRKVIVFQSSSIHCDIVGRPFSVLKLLLILLRNFLGKPSMTYIL